MDEAVGIARISQLLEKLCVLPVYAGFLAPSIVFLADIDVEH